MAGRDPSPLLESGGDFGQFTFTHKVVDIDWVVAGGAGVTLDVAVPACDEQDILDVIEKLSDLGWATPDARWSIQQSRTNWHGLGAAAFATELPKWRTRAATPDAHHSEEFCYLDNCSGGFYTLTSNLAAHDTRRTMSTELSFQLHGTPLDPSPWLQLCRSIGVHDGLYFRPLTEKSISRFPVREREPVEPIGRIVTAGTEDDPRPEWVTGIVIVNPYRGRAWRDNDVTGPDSTHHAEDSQYLICDLGQHHPVDGGRYVYRLEHFESTRTSSGDVLMPVARWDYTDEAADERGPTSPRPARS